MSNSPTARPFANSAPVKVKHILVSDPIQMPEVYSSTPGGTLYSTTPGGISWNSPNIFTIYLQHYLQD